MGIRQSFSYFSQTMTQRTRVWISLQRSFFFWIYLFGGFVVLGLTLPCCSADVVVPVTGQPINGKVFRYDEYSYIVLLEGGGKVVIPQGQIESIEWGKKKSPRYSKRSKYLTSQELIEEGQPTVRILVGWMKVEKGEEPESTLKRESQTLLYLMDSTDRYAEVFQIRYGWGNNIKLLEYQKEKDLLLRKQNRIGQGERIKILGPPGTGMESLILGAKGKIKDQKSFLGSLHDKKPVTHPNRVVVNPRSSRHPNRWTW